MKTVINFLVKDWNALLSWIRAHPFKAMAFAWWHAFIGFMLLNCQWTIAVPVAISYFCLFILTLHRDSKRVIPSCKIHIPLCVAMLLAGFNAHSQTLADLEAQQIQDQPKVGYVIGGAIIVGGGVAAYYMYRFCQKHFSPPPTNAPPDESACAFTFSSQGSCFTPSSDSPPPGVVELGAFIKEDGTIVGQPLTYRPASDPALLSLSQFSAALGEHGIYIPSPGVIVYGKGGKSAEFSEVPIQVQIGAVPSVAVAGGRSIMVVLERSPDLIFWQPLVTNSLPAGTTLRLYDDGAQQMFYRWSAP